MKITNISYSGLGCLINNAMRLRDKGTPTNRLICDIIGTLNYLASYFKIHTFQFTEPSSNEFHPNMVLLSYL